MTVAELQLLLSDLGKFLKASQAAKAAGELEYVSDRLSPFKGYQLKAFADFLVKAEEYARTGPAPRKAAAGRKRKPDPAAVEGACQHLVQLYDKAIDPGTTLEMIEAAVLALQDLDPPKAKLEELARQMGYTQKFKTKGDVVKAVRQKILGRKGAFDRVNA